MALCADTTALNVGWERCLGSARVSSSTYHQSCQESGGGTAERKLHCCGAAVALPATSSNKPQNTGSALVRLTAIVSKKYGVGKTREVGKEIYRL